MNGEDVSLAQYRSMVFLIVNTATSIRRAGPGKQEDVHSFYTGRFGITFRQFAKIEVNGENSDPLYKWLTAESTFGGLIRVPSDYYERSSQASE